MISPSRPGRVGTTTPIQYFPGSVWPRPIYMSWGSESIPCAWVTPVYHNHPWTFPQSWYPVWPYTRIPLICLLSSCHLPPSSFFCRLCRLPNSGFYHLFVSSICSQDLPPSIWLPHPELYVLPPPTSLSVHPLVWPTSGCLAPPRASIYPQFTETRQVWRWHLQPVGRRLLLKTPLTPLTPTLFTHLMLACDSEYGRQPASSKTPHPPSPSCVIGLCFV